MKTILAGLFVLCLVSPVYGSDVTEEQQTSWKTCDFPNVDIKGPVAEVMKHIESLGDTARFEQVPEQDFAKILKGYNEMKPPTNLEADSAFLLFYNGYVYLHLVKNGCVYWIDEGNPKKWEWFLQQVLGRES